MKPNQALKEIVSNSHNKQTTERIVKLAKNDEGFFKALLELALGEDNELARRAAWPLSYVAGDFKEIFYQYIPKVIQQLRAKERHVAIRRNLLRILKDVECPEKYLGELTVICFEMVKDSAMPPAVRAFAMGVIDKNTKQYPELLIELADYIEPRLEFESKAFISRGRKIVAKSKRLLNRLK